MAVLEKKKNHSPKPRVKGFIWLKGFYLHQNPLLLELVLKTSHMEGEKTQPSPL